MYRQNDIVDQTAPAMLYNLSVQMYDSELLHEISSNVICAIRKASDFCRLLITFANSLIPDQDQQTL